MERRFPFWPRRVGLGAMFAVLVVVHLIPIWSVHYVPTGDGPCHLYNSWLIKELISGKEGPIAKWYRIDWRPHPNWLSHAFLAASMFILPPLIAEKILLSTAIGLFLAGAWLLASAVDHRCRPYAFLAFPLAYNMFLQSGFYNFMIGVGLYLVTVATWWRRRDNANARTLTTVATLLVITYFAHALPTAMAMGSIGLLWLATLRGRPLLRHALHLLAFVPATLLLLWFAVHRGVGSIPQERSIAGLLRFLATNGIIFTFHDWQFVLGRALFVVMAALLIASIARENISRWRLQFREADAFLLLLVAVVIIYLRTPSAIAGGLLLAERISLFVPLLVIPALSPNLPRVVRSGVAVVITAAALANVAFQTVRFRELDRDIARFVAPLAAVKPGSTILPLLFDHQESFFMYHGHRAAYAAIDRQLVYLGNYQPATDYFPITWNHGVDAPDIGLIEGRPEQIDINAYVARADYVFTWRLPPTGIETRIARRYRLVARTGDASAYERRHVTAFRDAAMVLLPFSGTMGDTPTAGGARWRISQHIMNTGQNLVYLTVSSCALSPSCDATIAPGGSLTVASVDQTTPFTIVTAERDVIGDLRFSTVLERTDDRGAGFRVSIPAIAEDAFVPRTITIPGMRVSSESRLNLRLWTWRTPRPTAYRVRVIADDGRTFVSDRTYTRADGFAMEADLVGAYLPQLRGETVQGDVVVTLEDPESEGRVWAFVTSTDNSTQLPRFHMPEGFDDSPHTAARR